MLSLRRFLPVVLITNSLSAFAEETPLSWNNFTQTFNERYHTRSPSRMKNEASVYRAVKEPGFRLNPILQGTWQKNSQEMSVSQSFPWGTSISGSFSQTKSSSIGTSTGLGSEQSKAYAATLRQELLKGGLWHGFAQISAHSLNNELINLSAEQEYQSEFMDALFAFLDVQLQALRDTLARKDLERAQKEVTSIERDIAQGYKAKTDLWVFLLAKNRATLALQTTQNTYAQAIRNLDAKLWMRDGDTPFKLDIATLPPPSLLAKLEALAWPEVSLQVRVAQIKRKLAEENTATAARDSLPSLGLWHAWKKSENAAITASSSSTNSNLYSPVASAQHTYGLEFSMPLTSAIYREDANAAAMEHAAAESQFVKDVLADKHRKSATTDDISTLQQQVSLAEENVTLATQSQLSEGQKYRDGRSTIQEFRRSQAELADMENALVDARTNLIKRRIQFAVDVAALRQVMENGK